jgi:hypothetical protein
LPPGAPLLTPAGVLRLQRTLGNRAVGQLLRQHQPAARVHGRAAAGGVQRMVIRIRDVAEMIGLGKPTIMNASKDIKKGVFSATDLKGQEDVGIGQATAKDARQLDPKEQLVVVSHGSAPTVGSFFRSGAPTLGGYTGAGLAAKLAPLFPEGYSGRIYLDGCYTGKRLKYGEGTSFVEIFAAALAALRPDIKFTAQGNIGLAATGKDGIEYITLTRDEAELARSLGWKVYERDKDGVISYVVASPFGQAYADESGSFNDMRLSERAQEIAADEERKRLEAEERRRRNAPLQHPRMSAQESDAAWNDVL